MEIAILAALILLNGVFAMSEIALVTARKARLHKLIDEGDRAAIAAIKLGEDPTRFLSTIQIGITSIGVLNGIVGEAALAGPLAEWLVVAGVQRRVRRLLATGLVVVAITYFSIVVGELVPKRIGQTYPETLARLVARPIDWLAHRHQAVRAAAVDLDADAAAPARREGATSGSAVTEEEIHAMLAEGTTAGVIESHEHAMVRNVFRLDDRQIGSLMVPRADVVTLDSTCHSTKPAAYRGPATMRASRWCAAGSTTCWAWSTRGSGSSRSLKGEDRDLAKQPLEPPLYVPETLTGMELLDNFRSSRRAHRVRHRRVRRGPGHRHAAGFDRGDHRRVQAARPRDTRGQCSARTAAGCSTATFRCRNSKTGWGLPRVPEEEHGRYHTLSGMMMLLTGRLPKVADTTTWDGWRFEIVDMDGKTIDKVIASRQPDADVSAPADGH